MTHGIAVCEALVLTGFECQLPLPDDHFPIIG